MKSRQLSWAGRVAGGSRVLWSLSLALGASGCAEARVLDRHVGELQAVTREARAKGAYRCAPEELAEAEAQLDFAAHELTEGDPPRAREHLIIARANAYAALRLSTTACLEPHPPAREQSKTPQSYAPANVRNEPTMITARPAFRRGSTKEHAAI